MFTSFQSNIRFCTNRYLLEIPFSNTNWIEIIIFARDNRTTGRIPIQIRNSWRFSSFLFLFLLFHLIVPRRNKNNNDENQMSWPKQGIQLQRFFYLKSNWKREQNNRMKLANETETNIHSKTNNMLALTVRLRFKVYKYNEMIYHNYTHTIISNHYKLWFVIRLFYMFSMQKNKRSSTIKPKSKEKKKAEILFSFAWFE